MHLIVIRIFDAEGDVFTNCLAEQKRLLRNKANVSAQCCQRILAHRSTIDQDGASLSVVDTRYQTDQRALP